MFIGLMPGDAAMSNKPRDGHLQTASPPPLSHPSSLHPSISLLGGGGEQSDQSDHGGLGRCVCPDPENLYFLVRKTQMEADAAAPDAAGGELHVTYGSEGGGIQDVTSTRPALHLQRNVLYFIFFFFTPNEKVYKIILKALDIKIKMSSHPRKKPPLPPPPPYSQLYLTVHHLYACDNPRAATRTYLSADKAAGR